MTTLLQIAGIALLGTLFALLLKRSAPELGLLLSIAAVCVLLVCLLDLFAPVAAFLRTLAEMAALPEDVLTPLLQTTGIAVITKLTAESCRDAGEKAIASAAELGGSLLALTVAIPLFTKIIDLMKTLM